MADQPELTPIGELMARAPNLLTDSDIERIVQELRQARQRFVMVGDKAIGKPEAKKSAAQKKNEADRKAVGLNIDDILSGL